LCEAKESGILSWSSGSLRKNCSEKEMHNLKNVSHNWW
jgi:hypothetical protein